MGQSRKNKGIALISALSFLVITGIFVGIALLVSANNKILSVNSSQSYRAQLATEAGLEHSLQNTLYQLSFSKNAKLNLENLRIELDKIQIYAGNSQGNLHEFGKPKELSGSLPDGSNYKITIRRIDLKDKTILRLDSIGFIAEFNKPQAIRRISQDLVFYNEFSDSSSFAILANRSSGLFKSSIISSLETAYHDAKLLNLKNLSNKERELVANNYRVKVASLENILDQAKDIDSLVTGTIYSRGENNLLLARKLKGIAFKELNSEQTPILSNKAAESFKNLNVEDCLQGCSSKNAAFYENYPKSNYPDIELLNEFPLAINDENLDQIISDKEWQLTIANDKNLGSLKAGKKRLYAQSIKNADSEILDSVVNANALLSGNGINPLIIEGSVYFDGDVVISGKLTGSGKIIARGNIYIVGDISYACDNNSQDANWFSSAKTSCDYSKPKDLPKLALLAAKNIIIGDYKAAKYSPKANFNSNEKLTYLAQQMANYNRLELAHMQTNPSYNAKFYSFFADSKIYSCNSCTSKNELVEIDQEIIKNSSIISINPKDNWLGSDKTDKLSSVKEIHNLWQENIGNKFNNKLHIDALLHANQGIFGNLFSQSKTNAKMQINGSVFAQDISLNAANGLEIYFDNRLSEMINISEPKLNIRRANYHLLKQNDAPSYKAIRD
ncbi:MAG TPA: hypothetical protein ENK21_01875 [Trueperaceae bacterium]|nr:hypothetical protein [Trueperaceae bacterium]